MTTSTMTAAHPTAREATAPDEVLADRWYRAVASRDPRFDGWILVGVTSTGIYCRPSCPTPVRPRRENVTFHRTAAAAQRAGFRACKRCRPDAVPGSPDWDVRGDLVGRAMRLIADGEIDRVGVPGLADRLAVSERHLRRVLTQEVGAGPLAIARANRAQTARLLIETTALPFAEVAFAAGFGSVRQFSDTVREVFATTPTQLRRQAGRPAASTDAGADLVVRLPARPPLAAVPLLTWFAERAVDHVEVVHGTTLSRTLDLPHGAGLVRLEPKDDHVVASLRLHSVADLGTAVARVRRLLDLDADPAIVEERLRTDPVMRRLVRVRPGLRVPGAIDGAEAAIRAVVGQQVSVAAARTTLSRLAVDVGAAGLAVSDGPAVLFPRPESLAEADPATLPMPAARGRALVEVCRRLATGDLDLSPGADREQARHDLLDVPGIGPWTADLIILRGLHDPDVLVDTDLVVRKQANRLGLPEDLAGWAWRLSPWRSYATQHLWASTADGPVHDERIAR